MADPNAHLEHLMKALERMVAEEERINHSVQAFDGSLKIKADDVFVGKEDGLRALEQLRQFKLQKAS